MPTPNNRKTERSRKPFESADAYATDLLELGALHNLPQLLRRSFKVLGKIWKQGYVHTDKTRDAAISSTLTVMRIL
jgi:hypothetical protein